MLPQNVTKHFLLGHEIGQFTKCNFTRSLYILSHPHSKFKISTYQAQSMTPSTTFHQNRQFSIKHQKVMALRDDNTSIRTSPYGNFYYNQLQFHETTQKKEKPPEESLVFGKQFTDYMLEVDWDAENGWTAPRIVPYHELAMAPSCSALHYALQCFEGLKAYKNENGDVYLFRPEMNANRLNRSCARLAFPNFKGEELVKCIAELVKLEKDWIPSKKGFSLYIRPAVISTENTLGVLPPNYVKLFVILSPVGPYFKSGFAPVKLLADPNYVRAFPGGTGASKIGPNYGPTVLPQLEASGKGYSQVLWLYGEDHQITEVGTMNIFFYRYNENNEKELRTAPLSDLILPGVTRNSIVQIVRDEWKQKVVEAKYTMDQLIDDIHNNRLIEVFGAGTACVVAPVNGIGYNGVDYSIPVPDRESSMAIALWDEITKIQYGEKQHRFTYHVHDVLQGKVSFEE